MSKKRIFVAVQVPGELKNIAESYLEPFFKDRDVRIPEKEGWHITVVFCGYLDDREIAALEEIVRKAIAKLKPFEFTPNKILFASPHRPRMIWLTFTPSREFAGLKNKIENGILASQPKGMFLNFRPENREPNPHLTLARFEENYFRQIKKFLPEAGFDLSGETVPFAVTGIDIMESHLSRTGAEYELVLNIPLK